MTGADILAIVLAYGCGSIPFGFLAGKCMGLDIRQHGSGNIGATNVLRVCGAKIGGPVFFLDVMKGFLPTTFLPLVCSSSATGVMPVLLGVAAVVGHTFPVWLRFQGGKGVATSAGVLLALMPAVVGVALASFALTLWLWRFVSLSSTIAAVVMVLARHLLTVNVYHADELPATVLCWLLLILVIVRHRTNYRRLLCGTENRIGKKKSTSDFAEESSETIASKTTASDVASSEPHSAEKAPSSSETL